MLQGDGVFSKLEGDYEIEMSRMLRGRDTGYWHRSSNTLTASLMHRHV